MTHDIRNKDATALIVYHSHCIDGFTSAFQLAAPNFDVQDGMILWSKGYSNGD